MITKIAVKRPITTLMFVLVVVAFGTLSMSNLKLDMLPNMNIPIAIVNTNYSGASPSEMEELVTRPLEGALGSVARVKSITSSTSAGNSLIILEFEDNTDIDFAALDIRERVDLIKGSLPTDASDPMVMKIDPNSMSSFTVGISSANLNLVELKNMVDNRIVNRLERQPGVASVNISGGLNEEIRVQLIEDRLRGFNLSESQVIQILRAENNNTPIGNIKQGDKELQLRVEGEFSSLNDIENLPITTPTGNTISLSEIADVSRIYKENTSSSYIDGQPSINLTIQKQSTANVVDVSTNLLRELGRIQNDFPEITVNIVTDPADFVRSTLSAVTSSAVYGVVLIVIILLLFLRNLRSTVIIAAAMPISVVATFILMYYSNMTLNIMSLGGLALGIGLLIDNSIVVLESIFRKLEQGEEPFSASINGTKEVSLSVIASTITTVAVFVPITFAGGMIASIFTELALTIAFSLLCSLVIALTFVPMACSILLKIEKNNKHTIFSTISNALEKSLNFIDLKYKALLTSVLKKRKTTYVITTILIILTFMSLSFINFEFLPATDEGVVTISIEMPTGTLLETTEQTTNKVLAAIEDNSYIESISYTVGSSGGGFSGGASQDTSSITIQLVDAKDRNLSSSEVAMLIDSSIKNIPGAKITVAESSGSLGSLSGGSVDVEVYGTELNQLEQIANELASLFEAIPGTRNITTSVDVRTPQATIIIDRVKASSYGISSSSVASLISTAISGSVATQYKTGGTELDVRVQYNSNNLNYINDINNILIPSSSGINVPLYEIANIEFREQPTSINRLNNERYITVSAGFGNESLGNITNGVQQVMLNYELPDGYTWKFSGASEELNDAFTNLLFALLLSILLMYMIMAAQFESFIFPFIVMFSIPIAATGGLFGLFVMNESLSVTSFLGIIMLAGIVTNNAIVLIDYINRLLHERNLSAYDAIIAASPVRLRPILITTISTVFGLLPIMLSNGSGAALMSGLAVVVVFGLSISTFITLLLIPCIYLTIDIIREKRKTKKLSKKLNGA